MRNREICATEGVRGAGSPETSFRESNGAHRNTRYECIVNRRKRRGLKTLETCRGNAPEGCGHFQTIRTDRCVINNPGNISWCFCNSCRRIRRDPARRLVDADHDGEVSHLSRRETCGWLSFPLSCALFGALFHALAGETDPAADCGHSVGCAGGLVLSAQWRSVGNCWTDGSALLCSARLPTFAPASGLDPVLLLPQGGHRCEIGRGTSGR